LLLFVVVMHAQQTYSIQGVVRTATNRPLAGAHVFLQEVRKTTISDSVGGFKFDGLKGGLYRLHVSYLGYKCIHQYSVEAGNNRNTIEVVMTADNLDLEEVTITAQNAEEQEANPYEVVKANARFIDRNLGHSLIKSLESLPGIQAMEIGQGMSKPVIRGLGFNRLVVAHGNTKLEGQQWGIDHGLELDQFVVEQLDIIKGPASLLYGSDAIGGVIRIQPPLLAEPDVMETDMKGVFRSVNNSAGFSLMNRARVKDWFWYTRLTFIDFADYKVPADSFYYNRYRLPVYDNRLKNTAGTERNFYLMSGRLFDWGRVGLSLSRVHARAGFFSGSHGIPNANNLLTDGNQRNVGLPFQEVDHLTVSAAIQLRLGRGNLQTDLGWQQNDRSEWSRFHTHYPAQQPPANNPDLEFNWLLHTYSLNLLYTLKSEKNQLNLGLQNQLQRNTRAGYMFLLPDYTRSASGIFALYQRDLNARTTVLAGIRYDLGSIDISPYLSPYTGKLRAPAFDAMFHDFSWSTGISYRANEQYTLKSSISKSFRMPGVTELGSNGIHHGSFRYELGDTTITSEYAYQADLSLSFRNTLFSWGISPFAAFYPNFIFLSPSGSFLLPDGSEVEEADAGQVYRYRQSEAYRAGFEAWLKYNVTSDLSIYASVEYVSASDGNYPVPFTPPLGTLVKAEYNLPIYWKLLHMTALSADFQWKAAQNQVARNEQETPSYAVVNISISTKVISRFAPISVDIQIQNVFNRRYLNHLSFYRQLELPEAGRNIQLMLSIPLETKLRSGK